MPLNDLKARKEYTNRHYLENKDRINAQKRQHWHDNKEVGSAYHHEYYLKHTQECKDRAKRAYDEDPEGHSIKCHEYYEKNKDKILKQHFEYLETHREEMEKSWKEYALTTKGKRLEDKIIVLTHYGNGKCACVKCGYSDIRALSIDHINGGGRQHFKEIKVHIYGWLIKNNFPDGYQTLCMNDQWVKRSENEELAHRGRGKNNKYKIAT